MKTFLKCSLLLIAVAYAKGQHPLPRAELSLELVADGFSQPLFVIGDPRKTSRLFILEKSSGRIEIVEDGVVLESPFLELNGLYTASEGGLLGLAFHPNFPVDPRVFVSYTSTEGESGIRSKISELMLLAGQPLRLDDTSERVLLALDQPQGNHNGGWIDFGPDGYLYIALGDGGGGGDPLDSGQDPSTLLGTLLRIDVDRMDPGLSYGIPQDNPFVGIQGFRPEIWAYGLRNPWRNSFDRSTGDLWIADVGAAAQEELNFQPAAQGGQNYGWRLFEGTRTTDYEGDEGRTCLGCTEPIFTYGRDDGRSITGGFVYRGEAMSSWRGVYLFGDYLSVNIWSVEQTGEAFVVDLLTPIPIRGGNLDRIASFGEDREGELYLVSIFGPLFRVVDAARVYLGEAVATHVQGWKSLPWWALYNDLYWPYLYSKPTGWHVASEAGGADEGFFWFYDLTAQQWLYTTPDASGYDYRPSTGVWSR